MIGFESIKAIQTSRFGFYIQKFEIKRMKQAFVLLTLVFTLSFTNAQEMSTDQSIHQFQMRTLSGEAVSLEDYKGKVVLLVNVASKCGLTPQYVDLQEFYAEYKDQDFTILGFPANNFGAQEPGSNEEIQTFCRVNYGVEFPMFSKISVKGEDQHPLYQFLTQKDKNGVEDSEVQWNFQKYLVGKDGKLVKVIPPMDKVTDPEVKNSILELLN